MKETGFLLTEQDKENNEKIKSLVKNYFGLEKDSMDYFNRQIDNPLIDDVYFEAFNKAGSSKIEFDLPANIQETLDYGWQNVIKIYFEQFIYETGATYENFKSNKLEINKNVFKFKKAIVKFYTDKVFEAIESAYAEISEKENNGIKYNTEDISYIVRTQVHNKINANFVRHIVNEAVQYICKKLEGQDLEVEASRRDIVTILENSINILWQDASNQKISSDSLKIVLTFSFADWFLCSTGESWGSCLSLAGNSANYWYGLPGLIGDKNRIMIYITRGDEKDYRGIKTHHYLYRTWALLDNESRVNIVRWFPKEEIHNNALYDFLQEKTGLRFNKVSMSHNEDFYSKHEVELIWTQDGYSLFPYQDYTDWTEGDKTHIISGDSGMLYKEKFSSNRYVLSDEVYTYNAFSSLGDLIDKGVNICEARDEPVSYCSHCDERIEGEEYITPNGDVVCETCYHENYFHCEECNDVHHIDYAFYTEDGPVCEDCFHDNYFIDEIDDKTKRLEDAVTATDDRTGSCEFLTTVENALNNGYIYNEDDEIYYKSQYMDEIRGNWIHIDIAVKGQLELEFAV